MRNALRDLLAMGRYLEEVNARIGWHRTLHRCFQNAGFHSDGLDARLCSLERTREALRCRMEQMRDSVHAGERRAWLGHCLDDRLSAALPVRH